MKKEMYDVDLIKPDGSVKKIQTSEKMDDNTCYVEVKTDGSFPYNSGRGVGKILYKPTIEFPRVITLTLRLIHRLRVLWMDIIP